MAPLPRPILRFAVGTTLLAPAAATVACDERPPVVNSAAPDRVVQPPAEEGPAGSPAGAGAGAGDEVDPSAGDPPAESGGPGTPEPTPIAVPDGEEDPLEDLNVNTRPDAVADPPLPKAEEVVEPPRVNTNHPNPEPKAPERVKRPPRVNTPKPDPEKRPPPT